MKRSILCLVLWLTGATIVAAHKQEPKHTFTEVAGTSETEVVPDEIFISKTLQERMESKDKVAIDKQEEHLRPNLKGMVIYLKDLQLNSANGYYRRMKKSM